MSSSKLASWMNKTVNNNITFHSSSFYNICTFTYNEYFFMFPVSWEIILQQFVAFWTQIKLACFVPSCPLSCRCKRPTSATPKPGGAVVWARA